MEQHLRSANATIALLAVTRGSRSREQLSRSTAFDRERAVSRLFDFPTAKRRTAATMIAIWLTAGAPAAGAQVAGYEYYVDTEHLRLAWNEGAISDEGLEMMKLVGERHYSAIHEMLEEAPDRKVTVLLEGPGQRPDGSWAYPRVDSLGRVHLYQFGPTHHDYLGAYAHELVHAMRIEREPHHSWFFEEGLAELIALRVDEDPRGFPWYSFPIVVAAGQWLGGGEEISLTTLRDRHRAVNQRCKAQSYTLRSAFFDYLERTYGSEPLLAMAKEEKAGALEDYEKYLGKDFDTLVDEWRAALLASFNAIEDASAQAARYRSETPVRHMHVCDAAGDVLR